MNSHFVDSRRKNICSSELIWCAPERKAMGNPSVGGGQLIGEWGSEQMIHGPPEWRNETRVPVSLYQKQEEEVGYVWNGYVQLSSSLILVLSSIRNTISDHQDVHSLSRCPSVACRLFWLLIRSLHCISRWDINGAGNGFHCTSWLQSEWPAEEQMRISWCCWRGIIFTGKRNFI